jgi:branched-chain amino acid transport system substrate-binding protein
MAGFRSTRTFASSFIALGLCALLACSCSGTKRAAKELRVGFMSPMTGTMKDLGRSTLEGATFAVEERNGNGGIVLGRMAYKVVLVIRDSEDRPELAVKAAKELINRENVAAIVGPPMSSLAIPVARVANDALVPMITQMSTHPDVTKDSRCVYRVCFTDRFQGEVMARFARDALGVRRAAVLFDTANAFSIGLAELFRRKFIELGGEIAAYEPYTPGETDFSPYVLRIKAVKSQALFLPNFVSDILLQVEQVRKLAPALQIIGGDSMSFSNLEHVAKIEGAYLSTHFSPEIPSAQVGAFVSAYLESFGRRPPASAALTYDAFGLLFEAVTRAQSLESGAIGEALRGIRSYSGVTGIMKFEGSPDPVKTAVVAHVVNGEIRYHARIDP